MYKLALPVIFVDRICFICNRMLHVLGSLGLALFNKIGTKLG